jgi:diguanylate cyclase (GGDEF)-like protein
MSDKSADVLLITRDPQLRAQVSQHRPAEAGLQCVLPDDLHVEQPPRAKQCWLDLDYASCPLRHPAGHRLVYFYSSAQHPRTALPPGLFIRKPCTSAVLEVLWAGVALGAPPVESGPNDQPPERRTDLPVWLLEFQELSLSELCSRLIARLPARLGYADVSLYLHEPQPRVLSLAESNHTRQIDLAVRMDDHRDHLMVAVARAGRVLVTDEVEQAYRAHGIRHPQHADRYCDGTCISAPLTSDGELQGVLNFSRRAPTAQTVEHLPWPEAFAFLARSLQHARAFERAQTEARVDSLTGLFNHRWLTETLKKEIHRVRRFGSPLSLILIDLDGLKAVNDRAGHPAGDAVLQHVARKIVSALRQIDSAARMGGDEFVVVLPTADLPGAEQVAQRILSAIRTDAALFRGAPLPITASLGVAQWEPDWEADRLLEAADQVMYTAKRQGRNCLACRATDATYPELTTSPTT